MPSFAFKAQYLVPPSSLKNAIESAPLYSRIAILVKIVDSESLEISRDGLKILIRVVMDHWTNKNLL